MITRTIDSAEQVTHIGGRNNAARKIANAYKLDGMPKDKAQERLSRWNQKNSVALPEYEIIQVIHNVYRD